MPKGEDKGRLLQISRARRRKAPSGADTALALVGNEDLTTETNVAQEVSAATEQVLSVEPGATAGPLDADKRRTIAWLFRPESDPAEAGVDQLPDLILDDANFVWIDLCAYTQADLYRIAGLLAIHRHAIHATLSPWHRPSLVVYPEHFFVSTTVARLQPEIYRIHAGELDLIVGKNYLVSAHKLPLPFGERVVARARNSPELVRLDAAYMLYIVLDELLAYYEDLNRHVLGEIEGMEERALHDTSDAFLEDLLHLKRYAFTLSQLADQHREVFAAFLRPDFAWVCGAEVEVYFRDLQTRLARSLDTLLEARDDVNGAFEIYVSHMSHRTNQVIKVLTMVSTVLFTATAIIALFGVTLGTSIHTVPIQTPVGLLLMLLAIIIVSGGTLWGFHRQGWL